MKTLIIILLVLNFIFCGVAIILNWGIPLVNEVKEKETKSEKFSMFLINVAWFVFCFIGYEIPMIGTFVSIHALLKIIDNEVEQEQKKVKEEARKNEVSHSSICALYKYISFNYTCDDYIKEYENYEKLKNILEIIKEKCFDIENNVIHGELAKNRTQSAFTIIKNAIENKSLTKDVRKELLEMLEKLNIFFDELKINIDNGEKTHSKQYEDVTMQHIKTFNSTIELIDNDFKKWNEDYLKEKEIEKNIILQKIV